MKKSADIFYEICTKNYFFVVGRKGKKIVLKIVPEIYQFHHLAGASHHSDYDDFNNVEFFRLASDGNIEKEVFLRDFSEDEYATHFLRIETLEKIECFFSLETQYVIKKVAKNNFNGSLNNKFSYYIEIDKLNSELIGDYSAILFFVFTGIDEKGNECLALQSIGIYPVGRNNFNGSRWKVIGFETEDRK